MNTTNMMSPEQILAKAQSDPEMAAVLLLAHIAWSLERIATAIDEDVEVGGV